MTSTTSSLPPTWLTSLFLLFVKMLDFQSTDDIFLSEQRKHECRHQGHHRRGAHQIPLQTHLAHELRHDYGNDRSLLAGEDECKQEFVPGKKPAQYRQCRDRRDGRWQRNAQE